MDGRIAVEFQSLAAIAVFHAAGFGLRNGQPHDPVGIPPQHVRAGQIAAIIVQFEIVGLGRSDGRRGSGGIQFGAAQSRPVLDRHPLRRIGHPVGHDAHRIHHLSGDYSNQFGLRGRSICGRRIQHPPHVQSGSNWRPFAPIGRFGRFGFIHSGRHLAGH